MLYLVLLAISLFFPDILILQVFNLGDYRRKMESKYSNHELFNPANEAGLALREKVCDEGLKDVLNWLETDDGEVAVFDATNTTKARRKLLYEKASCFFVH